MKISDEAAMAVRQRLERRAIDVLMRNPLTTDPEAVMIAGRVKRVASWLGREHWERQTKKIIGERLWANI